MSNSDDDWETDPDFENKMSEKDKRKYGNPDIMKMAAQQAPEGFAAGVGVDVKQLRQQVIAKNEEAARKEGAKYSAGYGVGNKAEEKK